MPVPVQGTIMEFLSRNEWPSLNGNSNQNPTLGPDHPYKVLLKMVTAGVEAADSLTGDVPRLVDTLPNSSNCKPQ
jgi:hypothetical protein